MEERTPTGQFKVLYVDYGNRATLTADKLRTLDASYTAIPAQVSQSVGSGVEVGGWGHGSG